MMGRDMGWTVVIYVESEGGGANNDELFKEYVGGLVVAFFQHSFLGSQNLDSASSKFSDWTKGKLGLWVMK